MLQGRCILFIGDGDQEPGTIHAQDMRAGVIYNVKRGVWHSHTLSPDAMVLVVENRDTTYDNSPFCDLSGEQTSGIVAELSAREGMTVMAGAPLFRLNSLGTVWVNDHIPLTSETPHGGFKQSGFGKDLSAEAVGDYQITKHVMISHA